MAQLDRITQQPDVMGGKACICGRRVTVGNPKDELKTGTFHGMCSRLGIKPNGL